MYEPQQCFETIEGCKVSVLRGGRGLPLVFLHGARGAGVWLPFFKELADRFEVIVPEHPGFGKSDAPDWFDTIGDLANFYLEFIDRLKLRSVNLVGTSLGGWIAADLAIRNDSSLATLCLVSALGLRVTGVELGDVFGWSPEQVARNLFADQAMSARMLAAKPDAIERARLEKNALTFSKLCAGRRLYDPGLSKWLHRISRPTLIVWGDSDKLIPPQHGNAFRSLIPRAKLVMIRNCGHLPHIERMAETARSITLFIEESAR